MEILFPILAGLFVLLGVAGALVAVVVSLKTGKLSHGVRVTYGAEYEPRRHRRPGSTSR